MDADKFEHDHSQYERPNFPYRCGRSSLWHRPCHQGPESDGSCGGTAACTPFLKNDRWECRRPVFAGGPCENGPTPRGECSLRRPPCSPKPTLRVFRGRLVILAIGFIMALVGTSQALDPVGKGTFNTSAAGPLSRAHAKFTEEEGCAACHVFHGKGPVEWIKALFTPTDISTHCVNCHTFGGPNFKAHNGNINIHPNLQNTECTMCHWEHKSQDMHTRQLTAQQCNFCHKTQFESFSRDHPEFSRGYPYLLRNAVKFDHVTHLKKYFEDPKFAEKAPHTCVDCHVATPAQRSVRPAGYETLCADCHSRQITRNELVLMRLPELNKNLIDARAVRAACGMPQGSSRQEEEFLSVSTETANPIAAYLLDVPEDDLETYNRPFQELLLAMVEETSSPLTDLINEHTDPGRTEAMLAGLNPEVLKRAACAWGLNLEYDPPAEAGFGGWHADLLEVRYIPLGHADPVAKSWVEFALEVTAGDAEGEKLERAIVMRDQLLSPKKGVGSCIKCHAVTRGTPPEGKSKLFVEWNYKGVRDEPYIRYSHENHIEILGKGDSCVNCHEIDTRADYFSSFKTFEPTPFVSNFVAIKKKTCVQCHAENKIDRGCQGCHVYHYKPSFKKEKMAVKAEK